MATRPAVMSEETFAATVERIRRHCLLSGQEHVVLTFHGGEPTLVGAARFGWMCALARERLEDLATVWLLIQTNGTRLDSGGWRCCASTRLRSGSASMVPRRSTIVFRVDRRGRGSHDAVMRGIALLREAGMPFGVLCVVQPGADPLLIHRHFLELGPKSISYLLPSETHDTAGPIRGAVRAHASAPTS